MLRNSHPVIGDHRLSTHISIGRRTHLRFG
jgi:hypothetical protein